MSEIEKSFTTEKYTVIHPVQLEQDGWRLDQFVQKCMPTLSRQYLKKKIEKGEVEISGRRPPHKPSVKVHHGEKVTIITHNDGKIEEEFWRGETVKKDAPPGVVYEDKDLIVCNKPPFMITHPAGKNLFYCATVFFETIHKRTIHSIHRIDRETSGLLLLGKNPQVSQRLARLFEDDKVRKCYFFIGKKQPGATPFPFVAKERMDREDGNVPEAMMSHWPENSQLGKESETQFELLLEKGGYVLALALPVTGRQHQIRVHASCHGYPLLGEKLYSGDPEIFMRFKDHVATDDDHEKMEISRQALHAVCLKIAYPGDEYMRFVAPLPKDLADWTQSRLGLSALVIEELIHKKIKSVF
jgi:RluA family pseudouridine synthase